MLIRLFLLLAVVPFVETALLVWLADKLGFFATVAMVIGSGVCGAMLLKSQGLGVVRRIREEFERGRLPATEMLDGVLILMAGVLLLTPGILTDALGILLLIPVTRSRLRASLLIWLKSRWRLTGRFGNPGDESRTPGDSQVIDSYVVRKEEDRPPE